MASRREVPHRVHDFGYAYNYYKPGERLPRLVDCQQPVSKKPNEPQPEDSSWTEAKALFGQNDYIDLLGDGDLHPAQLVYHVPVWLRGFPGQHKAGELHKLLHYRNLYQSQMKRNAPRRWHELCKRIKYLSLYHNYRKQDEMHDERQLGLWNETPDYFWKDKERRSFDDMP